MLAWLSWHVGWRWHLALPHAVPTLTHVLPPPISLAHRHYLHTLEGSQINSVKVDAASGAAAVSATFREAVEAHRGAAEEVQAFRCERVGGGCMAGWAAVARWPAVPGGACQPGDRGIGSGDASRQTCRRPSPFLLQERIQCGLRAVAGGEWVGHHQCRCPLLSLTCLPAASQGLEYWSIFLEWSPPASCCVSLTPCC